MPPSTEANIERAHARIERGKVRWQEYKQARPLGIATAAANFRFCQIDRTLSEKGQRRETFAPTIHCPI